MIVSASYKTDIPAYYGAWFRNRLDAGYAMVRNPYGGKPFRVSLRREDVDGFVFWTRNITPFLEILDEVASRGFPFMVQYTLTGYPRALEAATPDAKRAIEVMKRLAETFGPKVLVWRYDPVVFTSLTPPPWHLENFARLAEALRGATDEVVLSFAQPYRKTARNMDRAAAAGNFTWSDEEPAIKKALLSQLAQIATAQGLRPTLCAQPELLVEGVAEAACINAPRLSDVAGEEIKAPHKPHRNTCGCWQSRDIGAYDSCLMGCAYCYAVGSGEAARRNFEGCEETGEGLGMG